MKSRIPTGIVVWVATFAAILATVAGPDRLEAAPLGATVSDGGSNVDYSRDYLRDGGTFWSCSRAVVTVGAVADAGLRGSCAMQPCQTACDCARYSSCRAYDFIETLAVHRGGDKARETCSVLGRGQSGVTCTGGVCLLVHCD